MALAATLVGISIPATRTALDEIRAAAAARDMAARIGLARRRSGPAFVGVRVSVRARRSRLPVHAARRRQWQRRANDRDRRRHRSHARRRPSGSATNIQGSVLGCSRSAGSRWRTGERGGRTHRFVAHPDAVARWQRHVGHAVCARLAQPVRGSGARGRTRVFRYDTGLRRWTSTSVRRTAATHGRNEWPRETRERIL